MSQTTALPLNDNDYVEVRCKVCNKFICEITAQSTGTIRKKCERCKRQAKISLPLLTKDSNIQSVGALVPA